MNPHVTFIALALEALLAKAPVLGRRRLLEVASPTEQLCCALLQLLLRQLGR